MRKSGVSESLAKEASEMEERLKLLRSKMSEFKEQDDKLPRRGGARWRSARGEGALSPRYSRTDGAPDDKGGVTSYAKEVVAKSSAGARGTLVPIGADSRKGETRSSASKRGPSSAEKQKQLLKEGAQGGEARLWGVGDVLAWLDRLSLSVYRQTFSENAIDGPILLELSLDDLDYMQITVLGSACALPSMSEGSPGHRKIILKGIEELKRNKGLATRSASANSQTSKESLPKIAAKVAEGERARVAKQSSMPPDRDSKVHWSALDELSVGSRSALEPPGSASLGDGSFDEEAERAAFQAAVMEWRRAGQSSEQVARSPRPLTEKREGADVVDKVVYASRRLSPVAASAEEGDDAWRNPFEYRQEGVLDEAKEHEVG